MKRAYNQINHYKPNINNFLNEDIFNVIFPYTNNKNCIFVCKRWYDIILKCSDKCVKCHKVIKMYDMEIWANDEEDKYCHEYNGTLKDYRTLKEMLKYQPLFFKELKTQTHKLCELVGHYTNNFKLVNDKFKSVSMCINAVNGNSDNIIHVPPHIKTEEFWIGVIKKNQSFLREIEHQTDNICLEAVKNNGLMLKYVKNQTEEICIEAIKENKYSKEYVKKFTNTILRMIAFDEDCFKMRYVSDDFITQPIYIEILKINPRALSFGIPYKFLNEEIILDCLKTDGTLLKYIDKKYHTKNMCIEAIKQNIKAIEYIEKYYDDIYEDVIKIFETNPIANVQYFKYINTLPEHLCWSVINHDPLNIKYIKNPTFEMCIYCVDKNSDTLNHMNYPLLHKIYEHLFNKNSLWVNNLKNPTVDQYIRAFRDNNWVLSDQNYITLKSKYS